MIEDNKTELIDSILKASLSEPNYKIYKSSINILEKEGNSYLIEVDSHYSKLWFKDKCEHIIFNNFSQEEKPIFHITIKEPHPKPQDSQLNLFQETKSHHERHNEEDNYQKGINPDLNFDQFIVGSNNRCAHAAAQAVAKAPAKAYNPLFIYGSVGLGKTHLLHAIAVEIKKKHPNLKSELVTCEKFTYDLINALKDKRTQTFKEKYRNVDVLLIDDIQFLSGKEATQEEFFHTFNALHSANKQIVITSDRLPKEIPTLQERLRTRFVWGLTADIQAPELETRIAILRKKMETHRILISEEVLTFIATQISANIRELEGALTKISAYASLLNTEITLSIASNIIKDMMGNNQERPLTISSIKREVSDYFSISEQALSSKTRTKELAHARQICMYLVRELTNTSLPKIGENFGNRDHSTVMHACDKIKSLIETDPETKSSINQLILMIKKQANV